MVKDEPKDNAATATDEHQQFELQIDLVYGARAIAALIGLDSRTLQRHASGDGQPILRIGAGHCADRRLLTRLIETRSCA
jgi:hypothetical protein